MRVLLIEDDPTTAKAIELMLGAEGFKIFTTDLGEEGLDLAKLYDYDIILLDLNLPDMQGSDVLRKVRRSNVSTPILMLSGIGTLNWKVRALAAGADDYVTKPFHRDELVARIHAIVRRSKGHSQSIIRTGKLGRTVMPPTRVLMRAMRIDAQRLFGEQRMFDGDEREVGTGVRAGQL